MRFSIQTLLVLAMIAAALFAWLRLDPGAARMASRLGLPDAVIELAAGTSREPAGAAGRRGGGFGGHDQELLVVVSAVGEASINDRVSAIGDGEAAHSVTVVPHDSGFVEAVPVEAGQRVEAGAVLAVLDSEKEKIARDQAALAVQIAEDKVSRYERLVQTRTVTEVQFVDVKNELENARLKLRDAQLALDRRSIKAPIDGVAGIIPVEHGEYVTQQTEIATIDDRSRILVDFWIPERFAAFVHTGQTVEAAAIALPGSSFVGRIIAIASRVDRDSRTLQVRAAIDNGEDRLRPGMSFRVNLAFEGETYPAVDPLAIQWSSNGPYVWKVVDEKAQRTGIRIIQRNSDYVLVAGEIANGEEVIIEGLQNMRPGSALKVARRSDAPTQQGS